MFYRAGPAIRGRQTATDPAIARSGSMTSGPYDYPGVVPSAQGEEADWFAFCREHRLMIQRCVECAHYQFPPRSVCIECLAPRPEWVEAAGTGTVFTFTIQHREASGFEGQAPYVVAMVDLDEGPRMMSRIVGPEPISIGMSVEVGWASIADGVDVPVFVSAQEQDS